MLLIFIGVMLIMTLSLSASNSSLPSCELDSVVSKLYGPILKNACSYLYLAKFDFKIIKEYI